MGAFNDAVYEAVCEIPAGQVATYGDVARAIGRPRAARFVGFALHANPRPGIGPDRIPCHRVVFADGRLCAEEIFAGIGLQIELLAAEGVPFLDVPEGEEPRVDLEACRWAGRGDGSEHAEP